jgi:taurine dioxygenase
MVRVIVPPGRNPYAKGSAWLGGASRALSTDLPFERKHHMSYTTIQVTQVTPRIGAEVSGIDLTATLSNQQVEDLHTALADHQVLFFRDQKISLDQQKTLGRHFGDPHIHPNTPGPEGHPEILPIHADANSKRANGENWHSDVSCDIEPPLGSILYVHTVPPTGGGESLLKGAVAP